MQSGSSFESKLAEHIANLQIQIEELLPISDQGSRNKSIQYPAFSRCAILISSVVSQLLTNGMLQVRNELDEKVDSERARTILGLFAGYPDGIIDAQTFYRDAAVDYCIDGNALLRTDRVGTRVRRLIRYDSRDARVQRSDVDNPVYLAYRSHSYDGRLEMIPHNEICHVRFPLLKASTRANSDNDRSYFAQPTIHLVRSALSIGLQQESSIKLNLTKAGRPTIHVNYDEEYAAGLDPAQKREIRKALSSKFREDGVVVTFGADSKVLDPSPQENTVKMMRDYQVEDVARVFGLPLPLLSVPVGQWSRGINEQIMKLAWRTCFSIHFSAFANCLGARLLRKGERFVPDITDFVRGDASGIAELVNATQGDAQKNPIASREELRHMTGLPKQPEGEIRDTMLDPEQQMEMQMSMNRENRQEKSDGERQ